MEQVEYDTYDQSTDDGGRALEDDDSDDDADDGEIAAVHAVAGLHAVYDARCPPQ